MSTEQNSPSILIIDGVSLEKITENEFGDLMTSEDFQECVNDGSITSYDGSGYWSTATHISDIHVFCGRPAWATHVVWYNK